MGNESNKVLQAAGISIKWKHYRDIHYRLYEVTGDVEAYNCSMNKFQLIIKTWMEKHGKKLFEAVMELCEQENDARLKIKFIAAGYELAQGKDYTNSGNL